MDDSGANKLQPEPVRREVARTFTPERWQQIKTVFGLAVECEPEARGVLLQEVCGGDASLRAEVESLLASSGGNGPATSDVFQAISPSSAERPPDAAKDPMLGRRIGAYLIQERVGLGGMAVVYRASRADEEFRKQVAVKLLRPGLDNAELLQRFRNERQTLAVLDHANIVKLLDGGTTDEGLPYLVMDYVDGRPIDEYCDAHRLTTEHRLRLFCTVCEAVCCAHKSHIIHRDLKPNNILVTGDGTPKLLDFGIAKVLSEGDPSETAITRTATRHLTPAYASPEQVRGELMTTGTDVYSLGVVLYELLTGHRPYRLKQHTPAEVERAICEQEPESPSTAIDRLETERLPDGTTVTKTAEAVSRTREGEPGKLRRNLRGDLDNILLKALQKDRERRYASVQEFEQDIANHLDHRPIKARPSTLTYRASKFGRRHPTEMIAAATVTLILLVAVGFSAIAERRAAEKARAELISQRSRGRRSVAVFGFKNLSARSETAWLSTALSEMLTSELAADGKIRTVPGENVSRTKIGLSLAEAESFSGDTLDRLYKNLGSDFVIVGSYLDLGDPNRNVRLSLTVQDAALGETVASIVESGDEGSLADLITRSGADVREKLGVPKNSQVETASVRAVLPSNPDALRLYAEGLDKLRAFDALGARDLLLKAVSGDPSFVMAHSALADAWTALGYDVKARVEAKNAFDLASSLTREESLLIEGQFGQASKDWNRTTTIYQTLFNFFPDNVDYGLRLAATQVSNGKATDALTTLESLHHLPAPSGSDPRIDLAEARAAVAIGDYRREAHAAGEAAAKGRALGSQLLIAQARLEEASALRALGDPKKANEALQEAQQLFRASGEHLGEARALRGIGAILADQGNYPAARKNLEDSLRLVRQVGNQAVETSVLGFFLQVLFHQGDFAAAQQIGEQYLASAREIGDSASEAHALNVIASIETAQNQFPSAQKHYEEALTVARAIGARAEITRILNNFGTMYLHEGNNVRAKALFKECLAMARQTGNKVDIGYALMNLADTNANAGEFSSAKELYTQALQIFKETGNPSGASYTLYTLAAIMAIQGDLAGAWTGEQESLAIREKIGAKADAARSRISLAKIAMDQGRLPDAESLARQSAEDFHNLKVPSSEADSDEVLANSLRAQGKLSEAQSALAEAQKLIANGDPNSRASIAISDARLRAASGKSADAVSLLGEIVKESHKEGWLDIEFEARLAIGEVLQSVEPNKARAQFLTLERDTKKKGYLQISRRASNARKQLPN